MDIICNRAALLDGLTLAGNVVQARTPKPVLQCVRLTAEGDRLMIAATDLEVSIRYVDTQVQVERPGETLVLADKLRDVVKACDDDTLRLTVDGDSTKVVGADSVFRLPTRPVADFPPVPDFEGEADFELPAGDVKRLIGLTDFAVAKEAGRYNVNGILFIAEAGGLSAVSTDGRRLALAKATLSRGGGEGAGSIVPIKAVALIDRLTDDPAEVVGFQVRDGRLAFRTALATLTTNLMEGTFPPYADVMPKDCTKKMTAGTADFLSAVRRAQLMSTEESKGIRMAFGKSGVTLTSRSPELGEATVSFACKYDGADMEIGFNPGFLSEVLRAVDADEVTLEMTEPNRPGLLRAGPTYAHVIMPVNLA